MWVTKFSRAIFEHKMDSSSTVASSPASPSPSRHNMPGTDWTEDWAEAMGSGQNAFGPLAQYT